MRYFGFGVVGLVVVLEQQAPQQFPHAQAMSHLRDVCLTLTQRTAGGSVASIFMRGHPGRDGKWIRCDPGGHCRWIGKTSITAARVRIYEASRGPVATGTRVESSCGQARCVNVDHLRPAPVTAREQRVGMSLCARGHELSEANVVRHRDGRIAYCRICRNERRRERYRSDPAYAALEMERQRRLRRKMRTL